MYKKKLHLQILKKLKHCNAIINPQYFYGLEILMLNTNQVPNILNKKTQNY